MAAGYRSPFFRWVGGINAPSGVIPPINLCTCPEFKPDGTLVNAFKLDGSLSNTFKNDQTLTNQWGKRDCNG
jgi:hypothetical protein